jgi:hypothetical protein
MITVPVVIDNGLQHGIYPWNTIARKTILDHHGPDNGVVSQGIKKGRRKRLPL